MRGPLVLGPRCIALVAPAILTAQDLSEFTCDVRVPFCDFIYSIINFLNWSEYEKFRSECE